MNPWLLLVLLLVAAGALLVAQRLRRQRGKGAALLERTLFDLRVGDIVQLDGGDWVVEDRLLYQSGEEQWLEYLLRDGAAQGWLCVEEDDWLEVSWLELAPEELARRLREGENPLPEKLLWEGIPYALRERGRASLMASARTLNRRVGECRYGDYEAAEGRVQIGRAHV